MRTSQKTIDESVRAIRQRLSRRVLLEVEFYEIDLSLLRDKWRKIHEQYRKKHPAIGAFDDVKMIRYIVLDAKNRELKRYLKAEYGIRIAQIA